MSDRIACPYCHRRNISVSQDERSLLCRRCRLRYVRTWSQAAGFGPWVLRPAIAQPGALFPEDVAAAVPKIPPSSASSAPLR